MKIKMRTKARGPKAENNWDPGDILDLPKARAEELIHAGIAEMLKAEETETAAKAPEGEKAVKEKKDKPKGK